MKIQQTAFMLIAVTLFFVLVGLFLLSFKISDLKRGATNLEEKNAALLVSKLANSPEFSCGSSFGENKIDCVDADKVMALKENIGNYTGFWEKTNIEIRKIYPSGDVECISSNYPNCQVIKLISGERGTYLSNFVALCRKETHEDGFYDKCELAKLMVSYEVVR